MERRGSDLSRRAFVVGAGASSAVLLAGCGPLPFQTPPPTPVRIHRLGWLNSTNPTAGAQYLASFRQALGAIDYVEGGNLSVESRWGEEDSTRLAEAAAELIRLPVEVLVMVGGLATRIAREATTTVPIVMAGGPDPVALGLAASYARPGGNVTGVTDFAGPLFGKRLQLLKEAVPSISRVAIFWDVPTRGLPPMDVWGRDAQAVGCSYTRWSRAARRSSTPPSRPRRGRVPARCSSPPALWPPHNGRESSS
jgi:hypothetical protein